jgi:hypothetical protein
MPHELQDKLYFNNMLCRAVSHLVYEHEGAAAAVRRDLGLPQERRHFLATTATTARGHL